MHEDTFVGLASSHVFERCPEASRAELIRISNTLSHGEEWRWIGGGQTYTAAGLGRIADELDRLGHGAAALVVRRELQQAVQKCQARSTPPLDPAIAAKRWDLKY